MKLPFSIFLALKYLRPKRNFISVVTVLSMLGVTLGVAVLIIVLSVMTGFDVEWRDRILGMHAHVTLTGPGPITEEDAWLDRIAGVPGVTGVAPYLQGLAFLSAEERVHSPILRGIDPARERTVSRVADRMVAGAYDVSGNGILLGADLARRMGVRVGDTVLAFSPQSFAKSDELRLPEELEVRGLFDMGMHDLDVGYALCSIPTARALFVVPRGVHAVQIMTDDPDRAPAVALDVEAAAGPVYLARTWMEQNQQLFAALAVEKNMMFFLLIFITVVAAFGITNTLITVTVQKTREIGLLKSLGFGAWDIMGIFVWQGWIAGLVGTAAGTGLGLTALHYRNDLLRFLNERMGLQLLPAELYQLAEIPSVTTTGDLVRVAVTVLVICTLAGLIPALRAARLDPAQALRYE